MTERNTADRDQGDWGADPELRALVCAGDPARSLPPSSSHDIARLVELTLDTDRLSPMSQVAGRRRAQPRRSRLPLLVAAAAVVVAGAGGWAVFGPSDQSAPAAVKGPTTATTVTPAPDPAPAAPSTAAVAPSGPTVLEAPEVAPLRCTVPNAEVLQMQQLAFEGTVSAVDGSTVTLATTKVFSGEVADTVQIQAPSLEMTQLLTAVSFDTGKSYLVSATNGQVTLCGFSAEATPDLQALYEQAFAG